MLGRKEPHIRIETPRPVPLGQRIPTDMVDGQCGPRQLRTCERIVQRERGGEGEGMLEKARVGSQRYRLAYSRKILARQNSDTPQLRQSKGSGRKLPAKYMSEKSYMLKLRTPMRISTSMVWHQYSESRCTLSTMYL